MRKSFHHRSRVYGPSILMGGWGGGCYSRVLIVFSLSGVKKDHIESWAPRLTGTHPLLTRHLCISRHKDALCPPHPPPPAPHTPTHNHTQPPLRALSPRTSREVDLLKSLMGEKAGEETWTRSHRSGSEAALWEGVGCRGRGRTLLTETRSSGGEEGSE